MSLKILIAPLSILLVFILAVGFIKPDYATLQEKKALHATKLGEVSNLDIILTNIGTLTTALETKKETEQFVQNYFPQTMDQGRVIDMLNFLAAQSGVIVGVMNLEVAEKNNVVAEEVLAPIDPALDPSIVDGGLVVTPRVVNTKSFSTNITIKGRYENIKDFFDRVTHMNRIHTTQNFSISAQEQAASGSQAESEEGVLNGSFQADFDYFNVEPVKSALYVPVFTKSAFDEASLDALINWVTIQVPVLEKQPSGRPNPFEPL